MYSATGKRDWLFNPSLLKLVHQCRRLILSEFGVKIRLSEADLACQLEEYASRTRSAHLAHTWETIKQQVPELVETSDADAPSLRMYRGQPIAQDHDDQTSGGSSDRDRPRQKKVIYRGQVIG